MELMQASLFGEAILVKKKTKPKKRRNESLKNKIKELYDLYEKLYEKNNKWLFDMREAVVENNIIYYIEERQAEPIELINLTLIENIDLKIERMRELCGNK